MIKLKINFLRRLKLACGELFIIIFCRNLALVAACAMSCGMHAQTTRKAYPDTFRQSGNVLLNDFDPQGDPLKCVRFNSFSIVDSVKITKKDTGAFILKKDGSFKAIPLEKFYGRVNFHYQMTDGKGGANSKGTILFIKEPITVCSQLIIDVSANDSCLKSLQNRFWIKVKYAGYDYYAYSVKDTLAMAAWDTYGKVTDRCITTYSLRLFDHRQRYMIRIDPETFYFIEQNACPE